LWGGYIFGVGERPKQSTVKRHGKASAMSAARPYGLGFRVNTPATPANEISAAKEKRQAKVRRQIERLAPAPGDILLFYGPERSRSRFICWFTKSRFYHVGVYAGEGKVVEARMPRVVCRNLYHQLDGYRFVVIRAPEGVGAKVVAWAEAQIGKRYDAPGVLLLALRRLLPFLPCGNRPLETFVCGSFVVRAFQSAGVNLFPDQHSDHIAPSDFTRLVPRYIRAK
jgi:cell wall-associated NlpC family hydrolase